MVGLQRRIVEEDHDPVPGKVLERPLVLDHERADRRVVAAQEAEHLFRLGRLGERREVPQVAEHGRDLAPMAGQHRLALGARHELGDLGREEAGQLATLAFDRLEQAGIGDPDGRLLGKPGRQRALRFVERTDLVARQGEDAGDLAPSAASGSPSSVR